MSINRVKELEEKITELKRRCPPFGATMDVTATGGGT